MGTESLSRLHDALFNKTEAHAIAVIENLPLLSDEELLETRRGAKHLGQLAWRIECAADAEIVSRAESRKSRKEIVEDAAKELGVTSRTINLNAQVHEVVKAFEKSTSGVIDNSCSKEISFLEPTNVNVEKHLVIASLSAENPVEVLSELIRRQEADRNYSMRDAKRDVAAMKVKRSDVPLPEGEFQVILADPPWRYDFGNSDSRIIENHYPTMELEDICALDIPALAAEDSVLFLWTTSPKLEQSFEVIRKWGFEYKTCMVWDKEHIGMGYYFRQQHELLLVCTKGSLPVPEPSTRPSSVLRSTRGKHSEKPEELYELLEAMYPRANKVELFCRNAREGWTAWGNEV